MYTLNVSTGIVTRDVDGKQVAPAQSAEDPDYSAYYEWVNGGGQPTVVENAPQGPKIITKLAFRRRFTFPERVAVDHAPENEGMHPEVRMALRTMQTDMELAEEIDLTDIDIVSGVQLLAQLGLIAPDRVAEILA